MAKKKSTKPSIKAEATAKAELVAKATYQRKHSITEVIPPDVTRAKASAWLDLISPITEWAGLKGDALRYQRKQLRIQQEEALERLARLVEEKMKAKEVSSPLPPKILVPALEAASLENPDSPLIEWWANLMVSGATGNKIRPYLLSLMEAIGPEEVSCLSHIWAGVSCAEDYISGQFNLQRRALFDLKRSFKGSLKELSRRRFTRDEYLKILEPIVWDIVRESEKRGIPAEIIVTSRRTKPSSLHRLSYSHSSDLMRDSIPVEVCLALKLLEETSEVFDPSFMDYGIEIPVEFENFLKLRIISPTNLGLEFLSTCQPIEARPSGVKEDG